MPCLRMTAVKMRKTTSNRGCSHLSLVAVFYVILLTISLFIFNRMSVGTSKHSCAVNLEHVYTSERLYASRNDTSPTTTGSYENKKGTVVIGILSEADNVCLREAQRKMFIPRAKEYKRFDIKVFFLLDERNSPALDLEQQINGDIVFLNTSVRGWGVGFARKIHIWLRYVIANYPDTVLTGRMDDDAFTCTPQIFDRLYDVRHDLLYYGYPTGYPRDCQIDCVDEMFLIIGIELARRVARRNFCEDLDVVEKDCLEDGVGGHRFRHWISIYEDRVFVDEKANNKMIWYYREYRNQTEYKKFMTPTFCEKYLLFHKATPSELLRWGQYNSLLLNDKSLVQVSEKDILYADICPKYI